MPNHVLALIAQVLIILGFTTGFVGLHNLVWTKLPTLASPAIKLAGRVGVPLGIIAIAGVLIGVGNGVAMPQTALSYHTLAVFMLTFIMLDEDINWFEFGLRGAVLAGVGFVYHTGHWASLAFMTMVAFFGFWFVFVWHWRAAIRYHVWRHIAVLWSIAAGFWLTVPAHVFGLAFDAEMVLCAIGYSSVAIAVSGVYLHSIHRVAVQSEVNAKKATFDALTGVKTYAAFQADLEKAFAKAQRLHQPLALITIDIDHFKAVNDQYGHLAGNDILIGIAKTLQQAVGASQLASTLYRTGGEEFTIICRQTGAQTVLPLARACWQVVREGRFQAQGFTIACTLSCGLAERQASDAEADELFSRADDNLYQSKARGRDTITLFGRAVVDMRPEQAAETYTFFTQRIVDVHQQLATVVHEVGLSHYERTTERWQPVLVPQPLTIQLPFMKEVAQMNPAEGLSVFLTTEEFMRPQTAALLGSLFDPRRLWVNLREVPRCAELNQVLTAYRRHRIRIIVEIPRLDQALERLEPLLPLIDGVKLPLAGLRAAFNNTVAQAMVDWQARCRAVDTDVIFTGIDNSVDAAYVTQVLQGRLVQGEAFDKPELPRLA